MTEEQNAQDVLENSSDRGICPSCEKHISDTDTDVCKDCMDQAMKK